MLVIALGANYVHAQPAFFMGLDPTLSFPYGISADGSVVLTAFALWTRATGTVPFGGTFFGQYLSADGLSVIGRTNGGWARWTRDGGAIPLPNFNFNSTLGDDLTGASADLSVLVGIVHNPWDGARWTINGTERLLTNSAWDVSADGTIILCADGSHEHPVLWTANGIIDMHFPIIDVNGQTDNVHHISGDGKVVVAGYFSTKLRWTQAGGIEYLPSLPDGKTMSAGGRPSFDGSRIVAGSAIWDTAHGTRYIVDALAREYGLGASVSGWTALSDVFISADGRSIVGRGTNPAGNRQDWLAFLGTPVPEPSTLLLAASALAPFVGRIRHTRMRRSQPQFIALVAVLAAASIVHGQSIDWTRQLASTDRSSDLSTGVSADGLGNAYLLVRSDGNLGGTHFGGWDVYLTKYNAAGNQEWARKLGTNRDDYPYGVSADNLGNVYITGDGNLAGASGGDSSGFIIKYDATGTLQWTRPLLTGAAVSADKLGNVFIAGTTGEAFVRNSNDVFVAKYDPAGNQQWSKMQATSFADFASAVSADGTGNVYVAGTTADQGANFTTDAFLSKYDSTGNLLWTRQSDGGYGFGASVDGAGNVYFAEGPFVLTKYDAGGNLLWTRHLNVYSSENDMGVTADAFGNVYISGTTTDSLAGTNAGGEDAFLAKYDAAGNLIWTRLLGTSFTEHASGVSADGLGHIYLSGATLGGSFGNRGGANSDGSWDAFLAKYSDTAVPEPSALLLAALATWPFAARNRRGGHRSWTASHSRSIRSSASRCMKGIQ